MKYIRDYYKKITLNVLKIRVNFINNNFYLIFQDMVYKLYNIFGEFNKLVKCDIKLYNFIIIMKMKIKTNKTFNEFYTRFLVIITLLNYSESHKNFILKRFITLKLRL